MIQSSQFGYKVINYYLRLLKLGNLKKVYSRTFSQIYIIFFTEQEETDNIAPFMLYLINSI